MKHFVVTTTINAPQEHIWSILTDGPAWPEWNPTVTKLEGSIEEGKKVVLHVRINPDRAFKLNVAEMTPPSRMVWSDGMPLGLFKGTRTYTLTPQPEGGIEFHMEEVFTGLLAPMITKAIPDMQPEFDEFARALKAKAEG